MPAAFTRAVSPRLAECALTHVERRPIDPAKAAAQHARYERALQESGLEVIRLPELPDDPDGVFVEDTAVLLEGYALIARPGVASREMEGESTAQGLAGHMSVRRMVSGRLDGGDVLRLGRTIYAGLSSRTNEAGVAELAAFAEPLGYRVVPVRLDGCLHLKSGVSSLGADVAGTVTIIINGDWLHPALFADAEALSVDEQEPFAANCLRAGPNVIMPASNPRTAERIRSRGFSLIEVDVSELQKAEAGVTCMSLIKED